MQDMSNISVQCNFQNRPSACVHKSSSTFKEKSRLSIYYPILHKIIGSHKKYASIKHKTRSACQL